MAVELTFTGIDITKRAAPTENQIGPIISGEIRFELKSDFWNTLIVAPFHECEGETWAKARAFQQLETFANELVRAVRKERAANGL